MTQSGLATKYLGSLFGATWMLGRIEFDVSGGFNGKPRSGVQRNLGQLVDWLANRLVVSFAG